MADIKYCVVTFKVSGGLRAKGPADWEVATAEPAQPWAAPGAKSLSAVLAGAGADGYRLKDLQSLYPDRGHWIAILEQTTS